MKGIRLTMIALAVLALAPAAAHATELYTSDPCSGTYCLHVSNPQPVVHVHTNPVVHVVADPVVVQYTVAVQDTVVVEKEKKKKKAAVDVEIDGGVGMWIIPRLKEPVNLAYDVRASLFVRDVIMTISYNWVPSVEWDESFAEQDCVMKGDLSLIGMGFGYRWNKLGHFHPEIGAKFDALILNRDQGKTVYAFGIGATVGLMADFPLPYGAIIGGIQGEAHYHVYQQKGFFPPKVTTAVIALLGYKF